MHKSPGGNVWPRVKKDEHLSENTLSTAPLFKCADKRLTQDRDKTGMIEERKEKKDEQSTGKKI